MSMNILCNWIIWKRKVWVYSDRNLWFSVLTSPSYTYTNISKYKTNLYYYNIISGPEVLFFTQCVGPYNNSCPVSFYFTIHIFFITILLLCYYCVNLLMYGNCHWFFCWRWCENMTKTLDINQFHSFSLSLFINGPFLSLNTLTNMHKYPKQNPS